MNGIRDLRLWQEAVALGGEVTRTVRGCSRRETRPLTDRILHTALDVATHVAAAYERPAPTEQARGYRDARATLTQLDTLLAVARQAGLLSPSALQQLSTRSTTVGRLLSGYLTFVDRQADEARTSATSQASVR
ncbi:MAG TPA: four helix bundle protein [Gemmatimonadaceae bacterium]|nr:four helix bundle protein [Gemmatimonadaceae bacterium]